MLRAESCRLKEHLSPSLIYFDRARSMVAVLGRCYWKLRASLSSAEAL